MLLGIPTPLLQFAIESTSFFELDETRCKNKEMSLSEAGWSAAIRDREGPRTVFMNQTTMPCSSRHIYEP